MKSLWHGNGYNNVGMLGGIDAVITDELCMN